MYESFYALNADPFRLSADPRFCFHHRSYVRAKASVQYALHRAEGFVMITGRAGTGKTLLVADLADNLPPSHYLVGHLVSSRLEGADLLRMTAHAFGLTPQQHKASQLMELATFFADRQQAGIRSVLIIDEAQGLTPSALQELRRLGDFQRDHQALLQIVLFGQEGLREQISAPEMKPIAERLVASWQLQPLGPEDTIRYVRHRLEQAGWTGNPAFEPGVLKIVYQFSEGLPRRINLICHRLMLHGFLAESDTISAEDARMVQQELLSTQLVHPQDDPGHHSLDDSEAIVARRAAGGSV